MFNTFGHKNSILMTQRATRAIASLCVQGMIDGDKPQHTKRLPLWA